VKHGKVNYETNGKRPCLKRAKAKDQNDVPSVQEHLSEKGFGHEGRNFFRIGLISSFHERDRYDP
jgi:hypothetical protein